jgi:kynurenine formamidase
MKKVKYIDLSWYIEDKMPVHPYDDEISLYQDKFLDIDKYNNFKLKTGTHMGTHIDSPMHMTKSDVFIGDYDLDRFCGNAVLLDVREICCKRNWDDGNYVIGIGDISLDKIMENDIVIFYTGHDVKYGTPEYYQEHPVLDIEVAEVMLKKKVKLVGFDLPSPDNYPFEVHKKLLSNGVFIVENLKNLGLLIEKKRFDVFMFPLKIKADASFIRAVAVICE